MSTFKYDTFDPDFPLSIDYLDTFGPLETTMHWHHYMQIGVCMEGAFDLLFTNKEYRIQKNDIYIVNNFEYHNSSLPKDNSKNPNFILIIFKPEIIAGPGSRSFDFEYLEPFRYNVKNFKNKIDGSSPYAGEIRDLAKKMLTLYREKKPGYRHLLVALLRQILALLIIHYNNAYDDYDVGNNIPLDAQQIITEIHANYKTISQKYLCEKYHMSESRLRAIFHNYIQMGFKEYINHLRISEARSMLLMTDDTIVDIATASGFSNINQFYKVFQKQVEMSPAEYRAKFKNINQ